MIALLRLLLVLGSLALPSAVEADDLSYLEAEPASLVYPPFWHTPLGIHTGTPEMLRSFLGPQARFSDPQALACVPLLSAEPPADPQDCRLTVVGVNRGCNQLIYNPTMLGLATLDGAGAGWQQPTGIALRPAGEGVVTDPGAGSVHTIRWDQGRLVPGPDLAPPPGGWGRPWGAAYDANGFLYITDAQQNRIHQCDPEGRYLRSWGPQLVPGLRLSAPRGLAVADRSEPWSYYHDDYIFVGDAEGGRLIRFDPHGRSAPLVYTASQLPPAPVAPSLAWLAVDYYENLWVTDPARCQVHKFDRHLNYLVSFGGPGQGDRKFLRPTGLAVHRHFGQVIVAEAQGAHYFWVGADLLDPVCRPLVPPAGGRELSFRLTEPALVSLKVFSPRGGRPDPLLQRIFLDAGLQQVRWVLPERWQGQDIHVWLEAEATYSSAKHLAKRVVVAIRAEESP